LDLLISFQCVKYESPHCAVPGQLCVAQAANILRSDPYDRDDCLRDSRVHRTAGKTGGEWHY
jgi:hypothetical protein